MSDCVGYAMLDASGVIVLVNDAWTGLFVGPDGTRRAGVGMAYPQLCDEMRRGPEATEKIRAALAGAHPYAVSLGALVGSTPGHIGPEMSVCSTYDDSGQCVGATVYLAPASSTDGRARVTGLTFPDVPRLELEKTLSELTMQAQGVLNSQGRLRGLLRANAMVAGELNLPTVLRHTVEAARELVGAKYAALGVLAADGSLEEFVHDGMDADTLARLRHQPHGEGILGLLISHPEPVRLRDLGMHPTSIGFPAGHPLMTTFLGVPIRVRDEVFGNLYLTESSNGEFSVEDEQLVVALAVTAGVAIENARLYRDSERRRRWQAISTEATQRLFTGGDENPLDVVLRFAMEGAESDFAVLARAEGDTMLIDAMVGTPAPELVEHRMVLSESVLEPALRSGKPVLVTDDAPHGPGAENSSGPGGSLIAAPLLDNDRVVAAVVVGRHRGMASFDDTDLDQLTGFVGHVGVALQLDRSRADQEALAVLREHDRIASDLLAHVIKELFATGMGMLGLAQQLDQPGQRTRLVRYVDAIDDTIRRMRRTIYQHQDPQDAQDSQSLLRDGQSLQQRVLAVIDQERPRLGFAAHIEFAGSPESALPAPLTNDILDVVRGGLSNAACHPNASTVTLRIDVSTHAVTVDVVDDGDGDPAQSRSLRDLRDRVRRNSGSLELITPPDGGTHLRWTVHRASPVPAQRSGGSRPAAFELAEVRTESFRGS